MDPFNFANNLLRLYETKVGRDYLVQAQQVAALKRQAVGRRSEIGNRLDPHIIAALRRMRWLRRAVRWSWSIGVGQ